MYNKVKLSKRQIKEDKFTTFMLNTKQFGTEQGHLLFETLLRYGPAQLGCFEHLFILGR